MKDDSSLLAGTLGYVVKSLRGYALLIAVDSLVYSLCFMACGVPYYFLFGVLSGCLGVIPVFGMAGAALLTLTAVAVWAFSWWRLLITAGIFLVYGCVIEQFFVYPMLVGKVLRLKVWEVLLALAAGFLVAGPLGMLVALPLWGTVKFMAVRLGTRDGHR